MTSKALTKWRGDRAARLHRLEAAYAAVGRRLSDGLGRALVLQIAAEFQGFARELHEESCDALVSALAPSSAELRQTLSIPYLTNRRLARGNAAPISLRDDFGLFGMRLWDDLRRRYPVRSRHWHDQLELLTQARNGLAHADDQKVMRVVAAGWPLTLRSARKWRGTLDASATG